MNEGVDERDLEPGGKLGITSIYRGWAVVGRCMASYRVLKVYAKICNNWVIQENQNV